MELSLSLKVQSLSQKAMLGFWSHKLFSFKLTFSALSWAVPSSVLGRMLEMTTFSHICKATSATSCVSWAI